MKIAVIGAISIIIALANWYELTEIPFKLTEIGSDINFRSFDLVLMNYVMNPLNFDLIWQTTGRHISR